MNRQLHLIASALLVLTSCHPTSSLSGAYAIDGDTFRFGGQRYRLARIDAPELPGHCQGRRLRLHTCAPGDPWASKAALQSYLDESPTCQLLGPDVYRRTLVDCHLGSVDINDALVSRGYAIPYVYERSN